ncbi:TetR family transcriptional regulator [Rhodococcus sp. Leaf7]|uniref:TetR family transcriptional regulator n=1 Tax=unclassified Rhodococcus (in: high G+C Gram-positive bacteria) TaxID=192944 RepID=UPI0006FE922C|nr:MULTISPECIES: TetR family transcriptional regulator [unclassified Rhodococcus (in: high G+C Gram-positive bacteria)]KQU04613.1 TetR family transcriptional regulator [Rhodococcus sp. Leaf7]KQU40799.1 TetR family transcriptional regulator [Rhodococcus sp. Leaf247]
MNAPAFYDELRALRRERLLDAGVAIIVEEGWDRLSMTRVATRSGIPRQSLYKEVGTKTELGEAIVAREVERFMAGVLDSFDAQPDSVVDGLSAGVRHVLEHGQDNTVLKAVLTPGHDPELLRLLTVRSDAVLEQAVQVITESRGLAEATVDTVVRLTLSHLLQPTVSIDEAVTRIRRVVSALV